MEQLRILWVAHAYVMPHAGVNHHHHPYYHMMYIVSGKCRFVIDNTEYILKPGHCLLIPRKVDHAYFNDDNSDVEYLEIKFSLLKSAFDAQILRRGVQVSDNQLVGMLFKQILKEYSTFDNRADDAAASYLFALLNAFGEKERYQKKQQFRYLDASNYSELSQRIISYLESHYNEDISLDALAETMGYNKSYLCVAFKKNTQLTILDCLNTIRIRRAAELVVYSEQNLSQVAEMCGFSSVSHFNRVFLKYVGITPGQCRRAYPADALVHPKNTSDTKITNNVMYSVLAQKLITPQMIKDLDSLEIE